MNKTGDEQRTQDTQGAGKQENTPLRGEVSHKRGYLGMFITKVLE